MDRFPDPQAGRVTGGRDGAMFDVLHAGEKSEDFLGAENDRQFLGLLGSRVLSEKSRGLPGDLLTDFRPAGNVPGAG